ncbi:uncharacterized protein LOC134819503 isoform X2 [Bolinopsis microptera]|uniref:uncharacterized protein LOC134819292 isoform X2 n=1 Tax=Bolinopsis microptera TaxID=2820187 RepID=UPI0030797D20
MLRSLARPLVSLTGCKAASTTTGIKPGTKYGGKTTVTLIPASWTKRTAVCTLIPGDGVGPEICESVTTIFKEMAVPVEFETIELTKHTLNDEGSFNMAITSLKRNGVGLKGVLNRSGDFRHHNMEFRGNLDTYANVVRAVSFDGIKTHHTGIDLIAIRENTEGEYSCLEHESVPGVVESFKVITREKSMRIAKFAFDYALEHNRKKVTCIHKANIMKLSDGLFKSCCQEVSELYPTIDYDEQIVDNTCQQLVINPQQFDVMVMPNLYGNLVSNLAAGLVGGAGVVPSKSYGSEIAVFEPGARHTWMEMKGMYVANPVAMVLSSAFMLKHLTLHDAGDKLIQAVKLVLNKQSCKTRDLGGNATTPEMTRAILNELDTLYA